MPSTVLGAWNTRVNNTEKHPCPCRLNSQCREIGPLPQLKEDNQKSINVFRLGHDLYKFHFL